MSTGERRRVLIARAMIHSPDALILDEPTMGLDVGARAKFLNTLQAIAVTGTTLVFVTHHVEELIPAIRHVIFLKHGTQQQSGTVDELIRDQPLSGLFDSGVRVERSVEGRNLSLHVER